MVGSWQLAVEGSAGYVGVLTLRPLSPLTKQPRPGPMNPGVVYCSWKNFRPESSAFRLRWLQVFVYRICQTVVGKKLIEARESVAYARGA